LSGFVEGCDRLQQPCLMDIFHNTFDFAKQFLVGWNFLLLFQTRLHVRLFH